MVRICGWLLILEAVIYFLLGVYHFHLNNGPELFSRLFARWLSGDTPFSYAEIYRFSADLIHTAASAQLLTALIESAVLFVLTTLALWTAVGFFRRWVISRTLALLVQAGSLLTALVLYYVNRPAHIVIMMVTGIFMVLYLNYADVPSYFNVAAHNNHNETQ
ncbi:MAG: hypothetical protein LLG42_08260 [Chloroflexi bacterium]|nr:hypothetical protein [Chloroflexota bacterium]